MSQNYYRQQFRKITSNLRRKGYHPKGWESIRYILTTILGKDVRNGRDATIAAFAAIGQIPQASNIIVVDAVISRKTRAARIRHFYQSFEWRRLRYQTLQKYGRKCMCCKAEDKPIHVDHIKPLRKYWELRLDPDNLQILCEECNHGKGNQDETDYRPKLTRVRILRAV
jgi:HNH endonuclease